jgi:glucans biosynthesis protein
VAYWVPEKPPRPRRPFEYGYRILWQKDRETRPPVGWVRETRRGRGFAKSDDGSLELHVDFEGPTLTRLPASATVEAMVWVDDNAEVLERHLRRNEMTGGWRSVVRLRRLDRAKPAELRTHLTNGVDLLTETWSYILPPE